MQRECDACGKPYQAQRSTSKFCSSSCRVRSSQGRKPAPVVATSAALELVTVRQLREVERLDTVLGQQAVALARRIDSPFETGAAVASLSKEFRAIMADALEGLSVAVDPLDELRLRRDSRRSAAG